MFRKIVYVKGRNFLGYGNKGLEYHFENGFTKVVGENGYGKSTLIDLLAWVLYGKTLRKMKQTNIINKFIKRDCYGAVEFMDDKGSRVLVERGIKPDIFKIYTHNGREFVALEKSSAKRDYQSEVDRLMGIGYEMFKQIIIFSVTRSNKKFLEMTAQEKRDIVANIFGLSVVDFVLKYVKGEYSEFKVQKRILNDKVSTIERSISRIRESIEKANENSQGEELSRLRNEVASNDISISRLKTKLEKYEQALDKLEELIQSLDSAKIIEEDRTIAGELSVLKYELSTVQEAIGRFSGLGGTCSSCGQLVDEAHREMELAKLAVSLKEIKTEARKVYARKDSLEVVKKKLEEKVTDKRKAKLAIKNMASEMSLFEQRNKDLLVKMSSLNAGSSTVLIEQELSRNLEELEICREEMAFHAETDELYDILISEVLSDKGIKSYYIHQFVPILNQKVNSYFVDFAVPFSFEFDSNFEYKIFSTFNSSEYEYTQLSEGQQRKTDLAINFAFNTMMKEITNWDCNLLIFDELLDSGVDGKSLKSIMNNIRKAYYDNGRKQEVIVISHKIDDEYSFDRSFIATQDSDGFSDLLPLVL